MNEPTIQELRKMYVRQREIFQAQLEEIKLKIHEIDQMRNA
jgi:hypothetical protein